MGQSSGSIRNAVGRKQTGGSLCYQCTCSSLCINGTHGLLTSCTSMKVYLKTEIKTSVLDFSIMNREQGTSEKLVSTSG